MTNDILSLQKITRDNIFRYIVKTSNYSPIEMQLDPTIFEIFDDSIYNKNTQQTIPQNEDFVHFQKHLANLRFHAPDMQSQEILSLCEELESIAPKTIQI